MSVDGTWTMTLNTPMGAQIGTLDLTSNGSSLEGTVAGPQGTQPIQEGTIEGDAVSWSIMAPQMGMRVEFRGTVTGDTMSGAADLGSFGSAPFSAERA
jgi:hypothetical protein